MALQYFGTGAGNQLNAPMGGMAQEANASGNTEDTLTWAGYSGRQGASRCQGFRRTDSPVAKASTLRRHLPSLAIGKVRLLRCQ